MAREPEAIVELRRALGERLATFRRAAELTQGQLAHTTICDRTNVVHIEKGRNRGDERFWGIADEMCKAGGVLLAGFHELEAAKVEHEQRERETELATVRAKAAALRNTPDRVAATSDTSSLDAVSVPTVWMNGVPSPEDIAVSLGMFSAADVASRRQVLAALSVSAGASLIMPIRQWAASLPVPASVLDLVSTNDIAGLEQAVTVFRRWDASGTGGLQRKALVGQLNAVSEMLRESHLPQSRQRLFQITAELAQLADWMAYDQGLHGVAQKYYLLALHACREAACPELGAKIIGDMTQLSTALGRYDDSLNLVRTALSSLSHRASPLVRSELLGLESRAYAQLGSREARYAVRSAETCLAVYSETSDEPVPDWVHYMNQAEVDCLAANSYIELALRADGPTQARNYARRAEGHTLDARRSRGNGYTRSRILDEIRLAKVRLAQGELRESVLVATRAIELGKHIRSTVVVEWLSRFGDELTSRHGNSPVLLPFRDRLREYVRTAASSPVR